MRVLYKSPDGSVGLEFTKAELEHVVYAMQGCGDEFGYQDLDATILEVLEPLVE